MTRARSVTGWMALLMLTGAAWGQPVRTLQTGTKTSEPGYVTSLEADVPVADMEAAGQVVLERLTLLREATIAAGFTPTGKLRAVLQVSMEAPPQATVPFLVQLYIAEQPTDADLKAEWGFGLLRAEPEKVAYTYHKGSMEGAQLTFMRLWQWTMAQGLDVAGYPYMVLYGAGDKPPDLLEIQLPVK